MCPLPLATVALLALVIVLLLFELLVFLELSAGELVLLLFELADEATAVFGLFVFTGEGAGVGVLAGVVLLFVADSVEAD